VVEEVAVVDMVEDAIRMNEGALTRHKVALQRRFADQPRIVTDKHKVLQILVNVLRNAKYACDESGREDKQITVRIEEILDEIHISVADNGVGIAKDVMPRLFNHGFTTRQSGHGFGLHGAALAARELGGTLSADSAGPGKGATFILTLPFKVKEEPS
jgi:signal transduction histidine kinase